MGGAIPGLVLLGFIRKQDEQSIKHYPSMSSASALASRFLPNFESLHWLPCINCDSGYLRVINPFLPMLCLVMVFHHSTETLTKTVGKCACPQA